MKLGCSYFGNRILKHVRTDMQELRDMGCTYVVHAFNENDMAFYHRTMCEIVEVSQEIGLEVHIDPWGVGKVFGGESFSNFATNNVDALQMVSDGRPAGAACPNHPKFRAFMREWVDAAAETKAEVLFWDEPHFYLPHWMGGRPNTWGCLCQSCRDKFESMYGSPLPEEQTEQVHAFKQASIVEFLSEVIAYSHQKGRRNALCVLPERGSQHSTGNWLKMAAIPHLDIFGTDPYWIVFKMDLVDFVGSATRAVVEACREHGLEDQLWLQGYKIPARQEQEIVQAVDVMLENGAKNIAVWGFDSCRHISWIRPDNPDLAWAKVKEAFSRARAVAPRR